MDIEKIRLLRQKLRLLEREVGTPFNDQSDCCGLTLAQCHTLLEIGEKKDISLVDLASSLGLDTSTLSRTIQGLVMIGLVNRVASDKDRRFVVISLTEQGRKTVEAIDGLFNRFFDGVLALIPEERRKAVVDAVGEFADAVRGYNDRTDCCGKGGRR
jgi:DNA-binding MarR family transcriptional regulator